LPGSPTGRIATHVSRCLKRLRGKIEPASAQTAGFAPVETD